MKNDLLKYKDYFGSVQYSAEDECLYGKVEFIEDLILYEGGSIKEITSAFQEAVDDYIECCQKSGSKPNITCKGSFNIRVGEKLHLDLAAEAMRNQKSLNEFIKAVLEDRIYGSRSNELKNIPSQTPPVQELQYIASQHRQIWDLTEQDRDTKEAFSISSTKSEATWTH